MMTASKSSVYENDSCHDSSAQGRAPAHPAEQHQRSEGDQQQDRRTRGGLERGDRVAFETRLT
jgi:hypothetical protein